MSHKRPCADLNEQFPFKKPNVNFMDITLNQDSLLSTSNLASGGEPKENVDGMECMDEVPNAVPSSVEGNKEGIENMIKKRR